MRVAGCVPTFNNQTTVTFTIDSLKGQSVPLTEIYVIDDGSTDGTVEEVKKTEARIVSMGANQGRGAARARAIDESEADLLLSVDGTNILAPDFLEKVLPWFQDEKVAAVYGRITQDQAKNVTERWRGRHLFQLDSSTDSGPMNHLSTWGFVQRTTLIREVGNFDRNLRQSEDREMGERLIANQLKVIYEPDAIVKTLTSNTVRQVFERYWRWNQGLSPKFNLIDSARFAWYAFKVMAGKDLKSGDFASAGLSLLLPYYCAWRSLTYR